MTKLISNITNAIDTKDHFIHDIAEPTQMTPGVVYTFHADEDKPAYWFTSKSSEVFAMDLRGVRYYRVYGTTNEWIPVGAA